VLYLPILFNGWSAPFLQNPVGGWLAATIVFGVGGATVYLFLFNRATKQSLHDLITGTRVVSTRSMTHESKKQLPITHLAAAAAILSVAATLFAVLQVGPLSANPVLKRMEKVCAPFSGDSRFYTVGAMDNTLFMSGKRIHSVQLTMWTRVPIDSKTASTLSDEIAGRVFRSGVDLHDFDYMRITLMSAYDLGIASGAMSYFHNEKIPEWQERVKPRDVSTSPHPIP
jgi:hypothetical protein